MGLDILMLSVVECIQVYPSFRIPWQATSAATGLRQVPPIPEQSESQVR